MIDVIYRDSPTILPLPIKPQYDDASKAFITWIETARRGEKYCYFTGTYIGNQQVARIAMKAYEKGTVTLYQKRNGNSGIFDYTAEKTR